MAESRFEFSVIIPVYNVEGYIEETIESVVKQTVGFKKHIQLILINDGSTDNSGTICEEYQHLYPENIIYYKQENSGVSVARNKGLEFIEGKYVTFLDSDDKWKSNSFKKVSTFFKKHKDEVDLVACRVQNFDRNDNYHALDYKFEQTKVVDIMKDYSLIQMNMSPTFTKAEVLDGMRYDNTLKYSEDSKLANQIILKKKKFGVVREAVYMYRQRQNNTSAMQNTKTSETWYIDTLKGFHSYMIELSNQLFGEVIQYVQYAIMYDMKWRIRGKMPEGVFDRKEEYVDLLKKILKSIDDNIINEQKFYHSDVKYYTLSLKYDKDISDELRFDKGNLYFKKTKLTNFNKIRFTQVNFININDEEVHFEGQCDYWIPEKDYRVYLKDKEENKYYLTLFRVNTKDRHGVNGQYAYNRGFDVKVPTKHAGKLEAFFEYKGETVCRIPLDFAKFVKLNQMENSYGIYNNRFLVQRKGKTIRIKRNNSKRYKECEKNYNRELWRTGKKRLVIYRVLARILKRKTKKPIWLISDRVGIARDNGEAFFAYLMDKKEDKISPYFVLSKKSEDYKRMKKLGRVVYPGSFKYKLLFLVSDKIISAHADENVTDAFNKYRNEMKNMYDFKYVFLQHGIIKDDLSSWLRKYNKNMSMFVTSAQPEYESVLYGNYGYGKDVVKLTGLPRYDKLVQDIPKKKQVIFLPTWRQELAGNIDMYTGEREYNEGFKETEFCKFYNKLMNDDRLLEVMRAKGYTGKFCLHTNHEVQAKDFRGNDIMYINYQPLDYSIEFKENSLMVTDYSSVAFDFAYMKKPVAYVQFDREEFFKGQVYDVGYFDYERDGLGPVCYNYEDTLQHIINSIQNDCNVEQKYLQRVDKFFFKTDTGNCKRVYDEIIKL